VSSVADDRRNPYEDKAHPWSSHQQIVRALARLPERSRVLDVGAASGTLGRLCVPLKLRVRGIEPEAKWIEGGRAHYAEVLISGVDEAPDAFLSGHDAVVCGDVLEHLARPEVTLGRLAALQASGCMFVVSVPNVANVWVRLNLLCGRFNYADRGILDRTHLRFFTRRSFRELLESAGLQVEHLSATPIPLDLVSPLFARTAIGRFLFTMLAGATRAWPTMLGFQWIGVCSKRGSTS
jgi:2-polyprenyl-3-methyl-5-hydroxy-6-metoxy-1,4-benzoquinol methylase